MFVEAKTDGRKCCCVALALAAVAVPAPTLAAPWDFGAIIDAGFIHTDNIFLADSGFEEGENVFTIAPELFLKTDGDRTQASIRYRPEAYFYNTYSESNGVFHVVDATLTTALIREKLFVQLGAAQTQSIVTPDARLPTSNLPITGNRVDSRLLEIRPYWSQRLGIADVLLELSHSDIQFDDPTIQGNTISRGNFSLNNFRQQAGVAAGVDYQYVRTEYEQSLPWVFQRASANLGYWVNGSTRLFAQGGKETPLDNLTEDNMTEEFWEVGFFYGPNERLDLEVATGERYYGRSLRVDLNYQLRRGDTSLTYNETPTTSGRLPYGRRPINDTDGLDGVLDEPGRADRYLQRRAEWRLRIELSKSEMTLRTFGEIREGRISEDGVQLEDERYFGAAFRWSWQLGVNTEFGFAADVSRRDRETRNDDIRRLQLDLAYKVSERYSIRLEVQNSKQEDRESNEFNYVENQYRLLLRANF